MTSHVILDAIVGVPIIHCNFLGYDEQAHRRGPSSLFAHWTLTGIDGCIRLIWRAAALSRWRKYEIWIYSDHGQEAVIPYEQFHGQTISTALKAVLHKEGIEIAADSLSEHTIQLQHARLLNPQFTHHPVAGHLSRYPSGPIALTANGPIGHLYLPPLDEETRNRIGQALVKDAAIPAVMAADGERKILAWTAQGVFHLPEDITAVLGSNHPFQQELQTDLVRLVYHPNAGSFVLFGWCAGKPPLNFGREYGGHAGFGPEETHGFALLPQHVPHPSPLRGILRPTDLRQAVLQFLQQTPETDPITPEFRSFR